MNSTHFLYREATGRIVDPGDWHCTLCGCACAVTVPVASVIRDTFNNHGMCRVPSSRSVCLACDHYFNHQWDTGQKYPTQYRKHSMRLVAGSGFHSWRRDAMRADMEGWLRYGCPECLLIVALSKKKHILPMSRVSAAGTSFFVQVEEECVRLSVRIWQPLASAFDGLLAMGCLKGAILSGQYQHAGLRGADLAEVLRLDRVIAPWRPSGLLTLVSYVTLLEEDSDGNDGDAAG